MSNSWELEKEKERTSFQCVGVSLSLHPSAFLDFFVKSVVTAVILCGSVACLSSRNYFPAEMGFRWRLWWGGGSPVSSLGASPGPPRRSLPRAPGGRARRREKGTAWRQRETGRWKVKQGNRRLICFLLLSGAAVYLEQ